MIGNRRGTILRDVQTLFHSGTIGASTDAELLGRFADRRDESAESAFAALVQRHGPMVLRVCRSVLRDDHDAQDAFQATFLILVRRAGAVRDRGSVGSWLYGVALRVSSRARAAMARRRRHEARAAGMAANRSVEEPQRLELAAVLHEEMGRLPERYRAAVVLCYLEGQTCEAAARQLGWPVGTVKSRLARGRERLLGRLIRRGLGPDESSRRSPVPAALPAALTNTTEQAMIRFADGRSTDGLVSAAALSWTLHTLRIMQMTRLAMVSVLLIAGLATTAAALLTTQEPKSARPAVPAKAATQERKPDMPATAAKKVELISVRVVDAKGRDAPNVEVAVIDQRFASNSRRYRTGTDGRIRVPVDPNYGQIEFKAHPDDRTFGWARIANGNLWPAGTDKDPVTLMLLPLNHHIEGLIQDTRGQPIRDVQIRVIQLLHDANNGFGRGPSIGPGVTDEAGRFTLSLPADTVVHFKAYHPRYFGPMFSFRPEDRTVKSVTLADAGGIAGTVIDSATGKPVEGVQVDAGTIELDPEGPRGGEGGHAITDPRGHFEIGGLAPGVFNLDFLSSPQGQRFTARAVEGVRVRAGENALADLLVIEGRRLRGTAIHINDNTPMVGVPVFCYSAAHPRSGTPCHTTLTDDQGRFEHFVPPGPALVYIAIPGLLGHRHTRVLTIPEDRDPEPVRLERNSDPNADDPRQSVHLVECEARVRGKTDGGDAHARENVRSLTGRIFDIRGTAIAGVRVHFNAEKRVSGTTDRMGIFRLNSLPQGELRLHMDKDGYGHGSAIVPPDAWEIDVTLPSQPDASE